MTQVCIHDTFSWFCIWPSADSPYLTLFHPKPNKLDCFGSFSAQFNCDASFSQTNIDLSKLSEEERWRWALLHCQSIHWSYDTSGSCLFTPNCSHCRVEHQRMHEKHRGHEAMHAEMVLILIVTLVVAQIVLVQWKQRHFRSYQVCVSYLLSIHLSHLDRSECLPCISHRWPHLLVCGSSPSSSAFALNGPDSSSSGSSSLW